MKPSAITTYTYQRHFESMYCRMKGGCKDDQAERFGVGEANQLPNDPKILDVYLLRFLPDAKKFLARNSLFVQAPIVVGKADFGSGFQFSTRVPIQKVRQAACTGEVFLKPGKNG